MSPLKSIKKDNISKMFSEEPGDTRMESPHQVRTVFAGPPVFEGLRKHVLPLKSLHLTLLQRLWKHTSTSRKGIRKPRTGDKADRMDTPVHQEREIAFRSRPGGCAGLGTYRRDDGRHAHRLLEDQPSLIFGRGIDDVSVNTASFL